MPHLDPSEALTHHRGVPSQLDDALCYTEEVARETEPLYARIQHLVPRVEWAVYAPYVFAINALKKQCDAIILAHNYQSSEIYNCVADVVGDSLQLAQEAAKTSAKILVQAGVYFMAETSKLLCPEKTVLIPDLRAGCSLAASITGEDVRRLRETYPGRPIVAYVNTSAEVKAEVDVCCTSSNAIAVVESLGVPEVIMVPDKYLAHYVASKTRVKIIPWSGVCEVHARFTGEVLREYREATPDLKIIAHPECSPDVIAEADYAGSTAGMIRYVDQLERGAVMLVTECSMASNVSAASVGKPISFVQPCHLCPHMQRITLRNIYDSLRFMKHEVTVPNAIAVAARRSVERMIMLRV